MKDMPQSLKDERTHRCKHGDKMVPYREGELGNSSSAGPSTAGPPAEVSIAMGSGASPPFSVSRSV